LFEEDKDRKEKGDRQSSDSAVKQCSDVEKEAKEGEEPKGHLRTPEEPIAPHTDNYGV
jgi:hypothetical protein